MGKEKVISVYIRPESVDGDPYVRIPETIDKDPATKRPDRETGKIITLWEEKLKYPYKTKVSYEVNVTTNKYLYKMNILLINGEYIYNGSNIPSIFWSLLGISKDSPEGLIASLVHDNFLQYKEHFLEIARTFNPHLTVSEFRALTTEIYEQLVINYGVKKNKAKVMGFFINVWQVLFNPDWRKLV